MTRKLQLGDDIDDFCVKCKRLTNHLIVAFMDEEPVKVRCRSCYHEHAYLYEKPPEPKKAPVAETADPEQTPAAEVPVKKKTQKKAVKRGKK